MERLAEEEKKVGETAVFCWGMNKYGECGTGKVVSDSLVIEQEKVIVPHQLKSVKNAVSCSSGGFFSAYITSQGQVFTFGQTSKSRQGQDSTQESLLKPTQVAELKNIQQISCGDWHMLALSFEGVCYGAGSNKTGAVGIEGASEVHKFEEIKGISKVKEISAAQGFSLFLIQDGRVFSTGRDLQNGLGKKAGQVSKPTHIKTIEEQCVINISAGFGHAACVTDEGKVYTWGSGINYQLGHQNKNDQSIPKLVEALNDIFIVQVSCTRGEKYAHTGCVDKDGNVYTWGSNYKGKLGHSEEWSHADPEHYPKPTKILGLEESIVVDKFLSGGIYSALLTREGVFMNFGCGSDGRLGHPEVEGHRYLYKESQPREVEGLKGYRIISASCSYYHSIVVGEKIN